MIEYMNTFGRIRDTCVFLYGVLLFCQVFFSKGCLVSKATCARFGCGSRQEPHATLDPGGTGSGVRANHWIVERYEGAKGIDMYGDMCR